MVLDLQRSTSVRNLIGVEDCRFNSAMDLLEKGPSPDQEVETFSIWLSDEELLVSRTTRDKRQLTACAEMGSHDMRTALELVSC